MVSCDQRNLMWVWISSISCKLQGSVFDGHPDTQSGCNVQTCQQMQPACKTPWQVVIREISCGFGFPQSALKLQGSVFDGHPDTQSGCNVQTCQHMQPACKTPWQVVIREISCGFGFPQSALKLQGSVFDGHPDTQSGCNVQTCQHMQPACKTPWQVVIREISCGFGFPQSALKLQGSVFDGHPDTQSGCNVQTCQHMQPACKTPWQVVIREISCGFGFPQSALKLQGSVFDGHPDTQSGCNVQTCQHMQPACKTPWQVVIREISCGFRFPQSARKLQGSVFDGRPETRAMTWYQMTWQKST